MTRRARGADRLSPIVITRRNFHEASTWIFHIFALDPQHSRVNDATRRSSFRVTIKKTAVSAIETKLSTTTRYRRIVDDSSADRESARHISSRFGWARSSNL
jgi:hypothetical protein